jgi:hypothetical protein
MPPFLPLHAIAAKRGDGLRPKLLALFRNLAADTSSTANADFQKLKARSIVPRHLSETYLQYPPTEQQSRQRR